MDGALNYFYNGDVAEVLIFINILDESEEVKVNYYLSTKWGLESSVDSDGDSFTDALELEASSDPLDPNVIPIDFSDTIDEQIGVSSNLDTVEDNLVLWLDASNIDFVDNSTLTDGEAISVWKDLSGNGHNLSQDDNSKKPVFNTSIFNGRSALDFNQSVLSLDSFTALDGKDDYTIIYVLDQDTSDGEQEIFHLENSIGTSILLGSYSQVSRWGFSHRDISGNQNNKLSYEIDGYKHIVVFDRQAMGNAIDEMNIMVDGSENEAVINTWGDITHIENLSNSNALHIGSLSGGTLRSFDGRIAEIIVFDKELTDDEKIKVNYYLSTKWGLTKSVDSDSDGVFDEYDTEGVMDPTNH